jgi:long-chain acyl-CoA synthetase
MMLSMFSEARLYARSGFDRRRVLTLLTEERLTVFGGVPQMFIALAATPIRGPVDLSALRVVFSASAPLLPEDNLRFFEKYNVHIRQLYGSTETGTVSINLDAHPEDALDSVGKPLPGVEVLILDPKRSTVASGEEGEIAISSPAAIRSYAGNDAANAEAFHDGYYLSGDLGYKSPSGSIALTGRKKFLINRGGYKVNPYEVEQAIRSHAKVDQVVVHGKAGRHGDDVVACVVVPRESCTELEIIEHCRGKIADFKIPSLVSFQDSLPTSETGKILRNEL